VHFFSDLGDAVTLTVEHKSFSDLLLYLLKLFVSLGVTIFGCGHDVAPT
jgi:hypothetical protein